MTIKKIEAGNVDPKATTLDKIEQAFRKAGVLLFPADEYAGEGVRLRKARED